MPQHREGSGQDRLSELLRPPDGKVADVVEVGRLVRDRGLEIDEPDVGVGRMEVADNSVVRCERRGHVFRTPPKLDPQLVGRIVEGVRAERRFGVAGCEVRRECE